MNLIRITLYAATIMFGAATVFSAAQAQSVEPSTQAFLTAVSKSKGPPIHKLPVEEARALLVGIQSQDVKKAPAKTEDRTLEVDNNTSIKVRIYRPVAATGPLPVIVYLHGGGWVLGDASTHDRLSRELTVKTGAAVVFLEYSRAPENQYPVARDEAVSLVKWIRKKGPSIELDPSKIVLAGDSAGANLAISAAMKLNAEGQTPVNGLVMFYPATDGTRFDRASHKTFGSGYFLSVDTLKAVWSAYVPDVEARKNPFISPIYASEKTLSGLPPSLVITAENDPLRDEGEAFARKLAKAGVRVESTRYLGTIHDFVMLNVLAGTPASQAAVEQASRFVSKIFK